MHVDRPSVHVICLISAPAWPVGAGLSTFRGFLLPVAGSKLNEPRPCRWRVGRRAFRTICRAGGTDERDQQFVVPIATVPMPVTI